MKVYVVRDKQTGGFLTESNGWSPEYPDAELFRTYNQAAIALRKINNNPHSLGVEAFNV